MKTINNYILEALIKNHAKDNAKDKYKIKNIRFKNFYRGRACKNIFIATDTFPITDELMKLIKDADSSFYYRSNMDVYNVWVNYIIMTGEFEYSIILSDSSTYYVKYEHLLMTYDNKEDRKIYKYLLDKHDENFFKRVVQKKLKEENIK